MMEPVLNFILYSLTILFLCSLAIFLIVLFIDIKHKKEENQKPMEAGIICADCGWKKTACSCDKIKKEKKMFYQQGDVLIKKINKEIDGKKLKHLILAEGEVTGHYHEVVDGDAELYEKDGVLYLKVISEKATVKHQEHKPITIEKGDYQIGIVKEYDHFMEESRNVAD